MTKVIPFSRFRYIAPLFSVLIIVAGLLITMLVTGVNLGIDFEAGINMRLQIAPISFNMS